jgi:pimeloyl-ACP methyl ester carboxylesterase
MTRQNLKIQNIPVILWGEKSDKLFIAVHGNMSNKADDVIVIFAEEAFPKGYQVLSFDLPEHGDRKNESLPCKVQNCVNDLGIIMDYAKSLSDNISLFACSMGAYFSLLTQLSAEPTIFIKKPLVLILEGAILLDSWWKNQIVVT